MGDVLVFHSKSPKNKYPGFYKGVGWSEYVDCTYYVELINIPYWRRKLSNMFISPFNLDGQSWISVENYYHAQKYRDEHEAYYNTFAADGGKPWSTDPFKAKLAGKAGRVSATGKVYRNAKLGVPTDVTMIYDFYSSGKNWNAMARALNAKFTQSLELSQLLLATKDAKLYHLLQRRGKESKLQRWKHLERIRKELMHKSDMNLVTK